MVDALKLRVLEVQFFQLPMAFKKPFRFGAYSLSECPQVFTRVVVQAGECVGEGFSAELAVPRWFDKRPHLSAERNVDDLFAALFAARNGYLTAGGARTVFELHNIVNSTVLQDAPTLPALVRSFGQAQIEKALIDAVCRLASTSFAQATRANLWGIGFSETCAPDLLGVDASAVLQSLVPRDKMWLRHTVGFPVSRDGSAEPSALSELASAVRDQGLRFLKIKLSGSPDADARRVEEICAQFAPAELPFFSLDGNEQYAGVEGLHNLCAQLSRIPALKGERLGKKCLFLEQPLPREKALDATVRLGDLPMAVAIDESDDEDDAFVRARQRGYRGVSSKACKGVIRSLVNVVRCLHANRGDSLKCFVTPEDLCTQPGWALQQDLSLAALTGASHAEKNGHQYVASFAGLSDGITSKFMEAHADLYGMTDSSARLRVAEGRLSASSINRCAGFGTLVVPELDRMAEVHELEVR